MMARKGRYKMQGVLGYFRAAPFDWALSPKPELRAKRWTFIVLECNHIKRDPWEVYQNEMAARVRATLYHTMRADEPRRVRCHQCVSGHKQAGVPDGFPTIYYHKFRDIP